MILEVLWDAIWTLSSGLSQFHGNTSWLCVKWRLHWEFVTCKGSSKKMVLELVKVWSMCRLMPHYRPPPGAKQRHDSNKCIPDTLPHESDYTSIYRLRATLHTKPRAVTTKLWEPKRKRPKGVPRHLQNHGVWSWILKCSVKSHVTRPSTKCLFNESLFKRVLTHDKIE